MRTPGSRRERTAPPYRAQARVRHLAASFARAAPLAPPSPPAPAASLAPAAPLARLALAAGVALIASCALAGANPHVAAASAPRFFPVTPEVAADEGFNWPIGLRLVNPFETGIYLDSLRAVIEDTGPGDPRSERVSRQDLTALLGILPAVAGRDSGDLSLTMSAAAERATITFELLAHTASHEPLHFAATVHAVPGAGWGHYPSLFLTVDGRRVEVVTVRPPHPEASMPGLLFVHGHGGDARRMLRMGAIFAARGYAVTLVSMPGYGQSDGPADLMGPHTMRALMAAFVDLTRTPGVDTTRLAVYGISRGAGPAVELAIQRRDVRAVVAQSGIYDLWAVYRGTQLPGFRDTILAEAGSDSSAWRERSPALRAGGVHAAVLLIHGENDTRVPAAQAHAFQHALEAAGVTVEAHFDPEAEHAVPRAEALRAVFDFLHRTLAE